MINLFVVQIRIKFKRLKIRITTLVPERLNTGTPDYTNLCCTPNFTIILAK